MELGALLAPPRDWATALHNATIYGHHTKVVTALVGLGADLHARDKKGLTPLHYADSAETVSALVRLGADVHAHDESGLTPLHCVAVEGHARAVSVLVRLGADVHAQLLDGVTALHFAAQGGSGRARLRPAPPAPSPPQYGPIRVAMCSAVAPSRVWSCTSAPSSTSALTTPAWPDSVV